MVASTVVVTAAPDTLQGELLARLNQLKAKHPWHTAHNDGQALAKMDDIDRAIQAARDGHVRESTEIINELWSFYCSANRFDLAVAVVQIRKLRYELDEVRVA